MADMGHLDGSIKLFAPDYKLESIRTKTPRRRNRFFRQGECQRLVLEILRDAEVPLSVRHITEIILQRKGLEMNPAMIEQVSKNTRGVVMRLGGNNVVRSAGVDGTSKTWKVC